MFSQSIVISSLSLLAATATAISVPRTTPFAPACEGNYLVEKWGTVVAQPTWNSSRFGVFMGCEDSATALAKRDDYNTRVEPNSDSAWSGSFQGDETPYDILFDEAIAQLCGETYCDGTKSVSTTSGKEPEETLTLSLDGTFADSALRDNFFTLVKDAFHKSVSTQAADSIHYNTDTFIAFAHATSGYGAASGYFLTMRMSDSSSAPGCPGWINTINSFGALVPQLSSIFGFAGAVCGAAA